MPASDYARIQSSAGAGTRARAPRWSTLATLSTSLFVIMLDNTVVNVGLAAIQHDLHVGLAALQWTINAYAVTFAVLLLLGGTLADYLGRRRVFMAGLAVFTLASAGCGLATSGSQLILWRTIQGIGAALMLPASLSIISATFAPEDRGKAIGAWAGVSLTALCVGPVVGGLLIAYASWNWIFFVNVPIGIAGLAAARVLVPESRDTSTHQRLDLPGVVTSAVALFGVNAGLIEANSYGWGSAPIVGCLAVGAAALAAFVALELRRPLPMLDLSMFRNSTFAGANLVALLSVLSMFGVFFFMSIYMQTVLGFSAVQAGATFLPMTVILVATTPLAGRLSDRFGSRWLMTIGMTLVAVALARSAALGADAGFADLVPGLLVAGVGFALTMTPLTAAVLGAAPPEKAGVASGVVNAFRQLGGSLGIGVIGAIVSAQVHGAVPGDAAYPGRFLAGFQDALLVGAGIALAGAATAFALVRDRRVPVSYALQGEEA